MQENRHRRRSRNLAIGITTLVCFAGPSLGSASADPGGDDFKTDPGEMSTTPLFPANDGPSATASQNELASEIVDALVSDGEGGITENGLPYQVTKGVLGIDGSPTEGYTLHVAKDVSNAKVRSALSGGISARAATGLTIKSAAATVDEITDAWNEVSSAEWLAEGDIVSYGMSVQGGQVVVDLSSEASDETRENLNSISEFVKVVDSPPIERLGR